MATEQLCESSYRWSILILNPFQLLDRVVGQNEKNSPELSPGEDGAMVPRLSHNFPPEIPGSYTSHTMNRTVVT